MVPLCAGFAVVGARGSLKIPRPSPPIGIPTVRFQLQNPPRDPPPQNTQLSIGVRGGSRWFTTQTATKNIFVRGIFTFIEARYVIGEFNKFPEKN